MHANPVSVKGRCIQMTRRRRDKLSPARKAHRTRARTYRKIREGISFLDCTIKSREKCSEVAFLEEYMQILNHQLRAERKKEVDFDSQLIYGKRRLKEAFENAYYYTIHVSSHGEFDKKKRMTYLDTSRGRLYSGDLKLKPGLWSELEDKYKPLLLVLSACGAGHKDLISAFAEAGCRYCVAPVLDTNWEHAALFSTFFYTYLFLKRNRPTVAFSNTIDAMPELTGKWKIFDRGKELPQ